MLTTSAARHQLRLPKPAPAMPKSPQRNPDTKRVQVPLDSALFNRVQELATTNRRTLGSMCVELIVHALASSRYQQQQQGQQEQQQEQPPIDKDKLARLLQLLQDVDL